VPSGVVPDTTGIRLQTAAGTPSFDSEGQVQGRLEVKVGDDWVTAIFVDGDYVSSGEAESTIACRQLGNELGYTLVSASKVGREDTDDGSGTVYTVACAGTESTLDSCTTFANFGSYHGYDVGVSCTFLAPSDECEECEAGKYSNSFGDAACASCAPGSFSTIGSGICQLCEAGKASGTQSATSALKGASKASTCVTCIAGTFASAAIGATSCLDCAAGTQSAIEGSVSADDCVLCEAGEHARREMRATLGLRMTRTQSTLASRNECRAKAQELWPLLRSLFS
jgi:hypothetical protein